MRSLATRLFAVICVTGLVFVASAHARDLQWVGCGITKKAFMAELGAAYERKTGVKIALEGGGATRGIVEVSSGTADIGGSCRHLIVRDEEKDVKLIPVGWDALVVITHASNPVDNLSLAQIKDIFTGRITNWSEVGGPDKGIQLLVRTGKQSGVGLMIREILFQNPNLDFPVTARQFPSSGPLEQSVEKDPWTIAITGISSAKKRDFKVLTIEGKEPSAEKIANGEYLLYRPLYLVVSKREKPEVKDFVFFALSKEGQDVIEKAGTVPIDAGKVLWRKYHIQMRDAGVKEGIY